MRIFVLHAHTANRGDESAVKAMVDEIQYALPGTEITICINGSTFYPNMPSKVQQMGRVPKLHSKIGLIEFYLFYYSNGKIAFSKELRNFKEHLLKADLVLHAPGGPSIGDIYENVENLYLLRLDLARKLGKPYMFYAPSMGPFKSMKHDKLRRRVLNGAKKIILRDPISVGYLKEYLPDINVEQALDSALQHDIEDEANKVKFDNYPELVEFLSNHERCVGITITNLKWHPKHKNTDIAKVIEESFNQVIDYLIDNGYGIVFIPQLYGANDDTVVMNQYMRSEHTFMVDAYSDKYDAYFQQYLIGKLYAVIGMRYHSNIFSAKMATPFVSVSYEQKMEGFMSSLGLSNYCIQLKDLSYESLRSKFDTLVSKHDEYKKTLQDLHEMMKRESHKSTDHVINILESKG